MSSTTSHPALDLSEILVATDLSETSERPVQYARALAEHSGGELLLVHVADPSGVPVVPGGAWMEDADWTDRQLAATRAAGEAIHLKSGKVRVLCAFGTVAPEIVRAARQHHATLIVVGTHSRRGLNRLLFGSDAESILRASKTPVLIIGSHVPPAPETLTFRAVLCVVQLGAAGAEIAARAKRFADENGATFDLVSLPARDSAERMRERAAFKGRIHELVPSAAEALFEPLPLAEPFASSLCDRAERQKADLIFFDHHASMLGPHFSNSVLADTVASAPCPVLALPAGH